MIAQNVIDRLRSTAVPLLGTPTSEVRRPRTRAAVGALAVVLLAVFGSIGLAGPAQAHNYLVSSIPAADSTLTELPESFDVTTNDALLEVGGGAGAFAFQVLDADGLYYGDGCVSVSGASMTATSAIGKPGTYTVRWQVLSADGHAISGEYDFTWAPTDSSEPSMGSSAAPVCGQPAPESSASPSEPAAPSATPAPSDPGAAAPGSSAAATADSGVSDDTVPAVLWIGGVVVVLAAAVVIGVRIAGRRRRS